MKRIFLIRRRRYLYRAVMLGFAAAVLVPSAALAGYDAGGAGVSVGPYLAGGTSAEDDHGLSAAGGAVLPAGDRKALDELYARSVYRAGDPAPPPSVSAPPVAGGSAVDWSLIALWASAGLVGMLGAAGLALTATRRRVHVAHP